MKPLDIGVIGCGYWGPNLARTFVELPEARLRVVADTDHDRLEQIGRRHPHIDSLTHDYRDLLRLPLDAVVVCTPPETHFDIVRECLEHGLDVLVEKPIATSAAKARELAELAERSGRVLMVGHIGAYNAAVNELRTMMQAGELGEIAYVDAVRVGLGLFRPDLNVIWDLAPHDIAILIHLLGETPRSVSARGIGCVQPSVEDVAYLALTFPSGVLAHVRLSWLDPCKTRRLTVVGKQKMVVYDDLESHEKLKIYDKSVAAVPRTDTFGDFQFAYHYGSVLSPHIQFEEPLRRECLHFLECVATRATPITDGRNGLEVVEVIEAAQESLRHGGIPVPVGAVLGRRGRRWRTAKEAPQAVYEPAHVEANGTKPVKANGVKSNGVRVNGVKSNGVKVNGIKANGVKANGKGAGKPHRNGKSNGKVPLEVVTGDHITGGS